MDNTFQLTTSRRGRQIIPYFLRHLNNFNSRPHEEVDPLGNAESNQAVHFNSRPHEEVDPDPTRHYEPDCVFQLTTSRRGRLEMQPRDIIKFVISTHDLTKRSTDIPLTVCSILLDFNSRPHEEVDSLTSVTSFWEIPFQLTTSRRGRPFPSCLICSCFSFQLTTSRRGRRLSPGHNLLPPQFQLTTSRRGRPLIPVQCHQMSDISTHDLTKRSTRKVHRLHGSMTHFNSRPHEEVDAGSLE